MLIPKQSTMVMLVLLLTSGITSAICRPAPDQQSTGGLLAATADTKKPIRIGFLAPLSGVGEPMGKSMSNGINLYLDQIHHQMNGHPVELVIENTESNPATAAAKFQKLVQQDNVDVVDGIFFSHEAYGIAPLVDKYKIPLIDAVAAADDLTQRKKPKWLVRTSFSSSQPMHPFGEYVAKTLKYKRVITLAADYPYGWEQVGGFQRTFEENGGQVVQKLWAPLGFKDFAALIKDMRKDADAVFLCVTGEPAEIIPRQFRESGMKMALIGGGTSFDESILPQLGELLNGGISAHPYSVALKTPANRQFVKSYNAKYGVDPGWYAECSYVSGMWIQKAVAELAGNIEDKESFLTALKQIEIKDAPRGPIKLDSYSNPVDNIDIRKVQKVNGTYENTVIYTYPMVSQFWKYDPDTYLKEPLYSRTNPPCQFCAPAKQ